MSSNVFAQELVMPTDAEIMEIINKYDFSQSQKEYLFKETKRKLQEGFASGQIEKLMSEENIEQNQNANIETFKTSEKRSLSGEHSYKAIKKRREQEKQSNN